MGGWGQDVRLALRRLRKKPLYAGAVVATLGLGVGVDATVFSIVDGVLLEPLPYPGGHRVVQLMELNPEVDVPPGFTSVPNWLDWRERVDAFEATALFRGRSVSLTVDAGAVYAYGSQVTEEFFQVFGVEPAMGRGFRAEEVVAGGPPLAVLSDGLWSRGYGRDPDILGRTVRINGEPHTIVGVMPRGFTAHGDWLGRPIDVWRPFPLSPEMARDDRSWHAAARLAEGVEPAAAARELASVQAALQERHPDADEDWEARMRPWAEAVVGESERTLWLLLAAALLVLLIACANVANLTLDRTASRGEEFATRAALGAGRGGVMRLVLVENGLAALLGGAVGVVLAWQSLSLVRALDAARIPRLEAVSLDWTVLAFALALVAGVAAFLTVASVPGALRSPARALAGGGGRAVGDRRRGGLASVLAVVQLVLSFALLSGAGLLYRSFLEMRDSSLGFRPEGVVAATVALAWERVETMEERAAFTRDLLARLRAIPGVERAGMINSLPLSGSNAQSRLEVEGVTGEGREPFVAVRGISPGYPSAMGIPLLEGRSLREADVEDPGAVLVNRTMARRMWGEESPLGRRVRFRGDEPFLTVVGVLGDVRHHGPREAAVPELYVPYTTEGLTSKSYVVRSSTPPGALAERIRSAVAAVDPDQPVREIRTMEEWAGDARADTAFQARLLGIAAGLATVLACLGLFGVLAAVVRARTGEIAVRVAMGADRPGILRMVLRGAAGLVLPALALGWLLGAAVGRALAALLFGVAPLDPLVFGGVTALFLAVSAASVAIPARRAVGVDPAEILREE